MLAVDPECVFHVSGIVVIPVNKVPVWVSHIVLIIKRINIEFFLEAEESLWGGI